MSYNYSKLQNGSDIRGVALPGVPGEDVNLTPEDAGRLSEGFLYWLSQETGKPAAELTVSVGRDPRLSGEALEDGICRALSKRGTKVLKCGLATTPAMFMSCIFEEFDADGAIMITASHLPFNRNGMKFFTKQGGLNKGDITDIIIFAESDQVLARLGSAGSSDAEGKVKKIYLINRYSAHLRNLILDGTRGINVPLSENYDENRGGPLCGLSIAVDAGNGAGGFFVEQVLSPLGADVSASRFLDPDGNFPNHQPNPENKEAMASISEAVTEGKCDLGLIFDTDVDRASAVDEHGREIARNGIVAMAASMVANIAPKSTVVTDSITSNELTDFLEQDYGLKHLRFKRGYRNVINKAIELNEEGETCELAIETSGHCAFKENYFLDDGAYLAVKIVIKAAWLKQDGKGISSVIEHLAEPACATEIRLPITADDFQEAGDAAIRAVREMAAPCGAAAAAEPASEPAAAPSDLRFTIVEPNYEGVRVAIGGAAARGGSSGNTAPGAAPSGWFLLRKSLHDPILPLNIECESEETMQKVKAAIKNALSKIQGIDISTL